jgi:hypothetical protein
MEDAGNYVILEGDYQFVMNISKGVSFWTYHDRLLSDYDDGTIRAVVLPDDVVAPESLAEALEIRTALGLPDVHVRPRTEVHPEYRVFDSFEFIGPMLMALFPREFENWISTSDQSHRASDFAHDVEKLRLHLPKDLSEHNYEHSDSWSTLAEDFVDQYILKFESKFSVSGERQISMLIQLAPGDWAELSGFENYETPTVIDFHRAEEGELASLIARWIESQHGGYAAAVALLVEPDEESDEEDDDVWERIDEMKSSFWGVSDNCSLKNNFLPVRNEELITEMVQSSPQFAEFKRIIENVDGEEYGLLLELAKREHPGFGGQMGLFAEWSTK